jgi:predicted membrane protein
VNLLILAMAVSIVLGMIFRKHEQVWRILLILLSISVTTLYFVFADRLM